MDKVVELMYFNTMLFMQQFSSSLSDFIVDGTESWKVALNHLAIGIGSQVTQYVVDMER